MGLWRWEDIETMPDPEWLIEGVLPAAGVSMVYGKSGTGKSFCVLDIAACVATGREWAGHKVKQGPVVYVAGEGGPGYKRRIAAWKAKHKVTTAAFYLEDEPVRLWHNPDGVDEFVNKVVSLGPVLVVFDTLATCLNGADENNNGHMRELLDAAEDISRKLNGAAALFVHHTGKDYQGKPAKTARGGQALQDGVAMQAHFTSDSKDGIPPTWGVLKCTKLKDAEPFGSIRRAVHQVSLRKGLTELAFGDEYATGPRAAKARVTDEDVLTVLAKASFPMSPADVAKALGCSRQVGHNHLRSLQEQRLVVGDGTQGYRLVRPEAMAS